MVMTLMPWTLRSPCAVLTIILLAVSRAMPEIAFRGPELPIGEGGKAKLARMRLAVKLPVSTFLRRVAAPRLCQMSRAAPDRLSACLDPVDDGGESCALCRVADLRDAGLEVVEHAVDLPRRRAFGQHIVGQLFGLVGFAEVEGRRE